MKTPGQNLSPGHLPPLQHWYICGLPAPVSGALAAFNYVHYGTFIRLFSS
jgi:hypothetical protein